MVLMETVSVSLAPMASAPLEAERLTQFCAALAVQFNGEPPEFVSV